MQSLIKANKGVLEFSENFENSNLTLRVSGNVFHGGCGKVSGNDKGVYNRTMVVQGIIEGETWKGTWKGMGEGMGKGTFEIEYSDDGVWTGPWYQNNKKQGDWTWTFNDNPEVIEIDEDADYMKFEDTEYRARKSQIQEGRHLASVMIEAIQDAGSIQDAGVPRLLRPEAVQSVDNLLSVYREKQKKRVAEWKDKPIPDNEFQAAVTGASRDAKFVEYITKRLNDMGIKATCDPDQLHVARTFVLIYSDNTAPDETALRNLTRAAERFNDGEVIIIPVIHPGCSDYVVDVIPDSIGYSLSNTHAIDFGLDVDGGCYDDLKQQIEAFSLCQVAQNISGLWMCKATVDIASLNTVYEFTMSLEHDTSSGKIKGRTVDGIQIHGEVTEGGERARLMFAYKGPWEHIDEGWDERDYSVIGEMDIVIIGGGFRIEGSYVRQDMSDNIDPNSNAEATIAYGTVSGTLERQGITAYFEREDLGCMKEFALVHRGGSSLIIDFPGSSGKFDVGVFDSLKNRVTIFMSHGRDHGSTLMGDIEIERDIPLRIKCDSFGVTNTLTWRDVFNATQSDFEPKCDRIVTDQEAAKIDLPEYIGFQPQEFVPLSDGEFACTIAYGDSLKDKAEELKSNLEERGIAPISLSIEDISKSRSIVLLLSKSLRKQPDLIHKVSEAAEAKKPIFNIGMDGWFDIFGGTWDDEELMTEIRNALARLNQTGPETLNTSHTSFHALVRRLRSIVEPPRPMLTGLWSVRPANLERQQKDPVAHDTHPYPDMLFLYLNQDGSINMASDFLSQVTMKGSLNFETGTFTAKGGLFTYDLKVDVEGKMLAGTVTNVNTKKPVKVLLNRETCGVSGFYNSTKYGLCALFQRGATSLTAIVGGQYCPGAILGGQLVFTVAVPADALLKQLKKKNLLVSKENLPSKWSYLTNYLYIRRARDGRSCTGKMYSNIITTLGEQQWGHGMDQVLLGLPLVHETVAQPNNDRCKQPVAVESLETLLKVFDEGDFATYQKILKGESDIYPKSVFEHECKETKILRGKYIPSSCRYVGETRMIQMGKDLGAALYEFECDFEKSKSVRVINVVKDQKGKTKAKTSGIILKDDLCEQLSVSRYDVMISYRSADALWVDLLQEYLEGQGILCWRDRRMEVGSNWSADITAAVRSSRVVMACISELYVSSSLCTKEVRLARDASKPVLPIVLPESEKLVRSAWQKDHLPITIAEEVGSVGWEDFRPSGNGNDPTNVDEFYAKYKPHLDSLLRELRQFRNWGRPADVSGLWLSKGEDGSNEFLVKLEMKHDGTISGKMGIFPSQQTKPRGLDKHQTQVVSSTIVIAADWPSGVGPVTIRGNISADGNVIEGYSIFPRLVRSCRYPCRLERTTTPYSELSIWGDKENTTELDMQRALAILPAPQAIPPLYQAFQKFDSSGDGVLDKDEISAMFEAVEGKKPEPADLETAMAEVDQNQDGGVDFYEFLQIFMQVSNGQGKNATNKIFGKTVTSMCNIL